MPDDDIGSRIDRILGAHDAGSEAAVHASQEANRRHAAAIREFERVCNEVYEPVMHEARARLIAHGHLAEVERDRTGTEVRGTPSIVLTIDDAYRIQYFFPASHEIRGRNGMHHGSVHLPSTRKEFEELLATDLLEVFPAKSS